MSPLPKDPELDPTGERLQKVLARVGMGSRRVAENLIAAGRVTVNGEVAVLGRRVETDHDVVEVDGVRLGVRPDLVWYLLNKPRGVMTTASDPHADRTVVELVPDEPRVFPVGRLDVDTEGLLLLTNDGDLTHRLTHPSFGVEKEYVAEVEGSPSPADVRRLREGVARERGDRLHRRRHERDLGAVVGAHGIEGAELQRPCRPRLVGVGPRDVPAALAKREPDGPADETGPDDGGAPTRGGHPAGPWRPRGTRGAGRRGSWSSRGGP
jgi:23S rRNA pseudouridine2605 synthase